MRYRICNSGNSSPIKLEEFIDAIEQELGIKAKREYLSIQPGDVPVTFADVTELQRDFDYRPATQINKGIHEFVKRYKGDYNKT